MVISRAWLRAWLILEAAAVCLALLAGCTVNIHSAADARAKCVKAECEAEASAKATRAGDATRGAAPAAQ
jgi:hypothetical protein